MTVATIVGGASFALVHKIAPYLAPGEYSRFTTMLQMVNIVSLAAVGFQIVVARVVAASLTEASRRDAACTVRRALVLAVGLWLLLIPVGGVCRTWIGGTGAWPWIWLAAVCLCLLLQLTLVGVLQGAQDFRRFGGISILSGVGRLGLVWALVVSCGWGVPGAMAGMFVASLLCVAIAGRWAWPLLRPRAGRCAWLPLVRQCATLIAGVGALSLLLSLDQVLSRRYLSPGEADTYAAAGTIGRVVVLITVPLTNVMFPKVARSIAEASRPSAFFHALALASFVGIGAAIACSLFPALPIRLLQGSRFLDAVPLVPLFAWAMLPLTLANILVNNLLARGRFAVVPILVLLSAGYWLFLEAYHDSARAIIQAIFLFASAACVLSGLACWLDRGPRPAAPQARKTA